jgi:hypothetical protein
VQALWSCNQRQIAIFECAPWGVTKAGCIGRGGKEHIVVGIRLVARFRFLRSGSSPHANDRTGRGWCIGDIYRFLGCCSYCVLPTLKFSDPMGLPHVGKRCVPYIVPEVFHANLNLVVKRSGYGDFLA